MLINVLIVEDEPLFRQMLRTQLSTHQELQVIGDVASGEEAIELAERFDPDVVLMDIALGSGLNGIQAGQIIKSKSPATGIVVLSMHNDKQFLASMEQQPGGWAYLLKKNVRNAEALVNAIEGSLWGKVVIDPELIAGLEPRPNEPLARLDEEDVKILELVAQGDTNTAIAAKLNIADRRAVQERLGRIYQALSIASDGNSEPRVKAVLAYLEQTRNR